MNPVSSGSGAGVQQIIAMRQQIIDRSDALKALHAPTPATTPATTPPAAQPGGSFAATLDGALDQVKSVQARSEAMGAAYQRGEVTDVAKVMLARQEASVAFEATLQVRNKLLSAYQDIMRMGL
jgi:flagellar hook-basal body complex protein FliE